ncbi:protein argonaute [Stemphylium lycopersici]|uniref:Protein argonaute n=1 Tax=Stemphylium lycopersici TaxID=183478 RepID=A0A364MV71_STELY|nr:protein argonaute [Stemphylium lycopersici]RAR04469.1 protein argonaute [Stemphylium lycopersici]RAR04938.1 protein argonaute [Stemphylium lycopersici]
MPLGHQLKVPGLFATSGLTNPIPDSFFVRAHIAIKGTARSAHYHTPEDGMEFGINKLSQLKTMLCYAFGRATTVVSSPPHAKGKRKRVTKEWINEAKKAFGQSVSGSEAVWGKHYGKPFGDCDYEK